MNTKTSCYIRCSAPDGIRWTRGHDLLYAGV